MICLCSLLHFMSLELSVESFNWHFIYVISFSDWGDFVLQMRWQGSTWTSCWLLWNYIFFHEDSNRSAICYISQKLEIYFSPGRDLKRTIRIEKSEMSACFLWLQLSLPLISQWCPTYAWHYCSWSPGSTLQCPMNLLYISWRLVSKATLSFFRVAEF